MNKRLFWINVCKSRGFKTNGELLSTTVLSLTSTSSTLLSKLLSKTMLSPTLHSYTFLFTSQFKLSYYNCVG